MGDLNKEISKNIALVYDNDKSFIERFSNKSEEVTGIYFFYMGGSKHIVKFECDTCWTQPYDTFERVIPAFAFDLWVKEQTTNE